MIEYFLYEPGVLARVYKQEAGRHFYWSWVDSAWCPSLITSFSGFDFLPISEQRAQEEIAAGPEGALLA